MLGINFQKISAFYYFLKCDKNEYLNVVPSGWLDVAEGFKYPAICVYVPNYRSLAQNYLQVRAKWYKIISKGGKNEK